MDELKKTNILQASFIILAWVARSMVNANQR